MTIERSSAYIAGLVNELRKLPHETEWAEFKVNHADPEVLGEYVSALANSAALAGKAFAYLVWGIEDAGHKIVGTEFDPKSCKAGNEELENWLLHSLQPRIHLQFLSTLVDSRRIVLLEVERAAHTPILFRKEGFIRWRILDWDV